MEAYPELIKALTHAIESLSLALSSESGKGYIVPVVTGLIGVFSGLIVVTIQSNRADKRAVVQREEERKRGVYILAAEKLAKLPKHITSLRKMTEGKAADEDEIISMSAVLAQVVQVSSTETAKLAIKLSSQINRTGVIAIQQLFTLNNLQSELNVINQQLDRIQGFSGNRKAEAHQSQSDSTKLTQENLTALLQKQHQLVIEVSKEQVEYLKWCRENLRGPLDNCFELQIQIRKEFGLPDGEEDLRELAKLERITFDTEMKRVIDSLKQTITHQEAVQS